MINRKSILGPAAVLLIAAILSVALALSQRATDSGKTVEQLQKEGYIGAPEHLEQHRLVIGKPMPRLELSDWIGKTVTVDDMRGKLVVIDFWATWCGPCIGAIPRNNEFFAKYGSKGVVLIGACGGGGEEKMPEVAREHKVAYPMAKVSEASTKDWQVQYWPTYAVIDRAGTVRALGIGPDYVDKILDVLLNEQAEKK